MESATNKYKNIFDVLLIFYNNIIIKNRRIMSIFERRQNNFEIIVREFMCFFQENDCHKLFEENRQNLIDKISEMKDVDGELYEFALVTAINNTFGNYEDAYKLDYEDETDGELVVQCEMLNSEETVNIGKVYYKGEESIFTRFLSKCNFPRSDDEISYSIDSFIDKLIIMRELETETRIQYNRLTSEITLDRIAKLENSITVALVPFVGSKDYLNIKEEGIKFTINIKNNKENFTHIKDIMDELSKRGVNVVIFPEMTFTLEIKRELQKYLRKNKNPFELIVSGSVWENKTNKCYILNNKGQVLLEQVKVYPFLHRPDPKMKIKGNGEGINMNGEDAIINIIDINKFGRVATPICVDFVNEEYYNKLAVGGVNVALNPVCTGSLTKFDLNAKQLGTKNKATVFISNTCIFRSNENIGFIYVPIKLDDKAMPINSSELMYKRRNECSDCTRECINKICAKIVKFSNNACVTEEIIL
ncbi:carbon-nitrogen hydrolase family protein [Clostridium mediterraneense]|uniref:carbon-nitrogen hydrolase family protein n=1 Tax=Clostridium mediterraneense TaxID=1805472 RepID=UPI00082A514E|nr:carbon-nitrogen hydrolase family protein [Clostridium mediterraneense]